MAKLHTDREILQCVYEMYSGDYPAKGDPLVPVDLHAIAKRLGCTAHLLFGRLYHDMGTRLRHRDPNNPHVILASIFEVKAGSQRHLVNVPYLAAVLASLEEQRRRDLWTTWLSVIAIVVAVGSAAVQWATATNATQAPEAPSASAQRQPA